MDHIRALSLSLCVSSPTSLHARAKLVIDIDGDVYLGMCCGAHAVIRSDQTCASHASAGLSWQTQESGDLKTERLSCMA
jgi:hypothetical protein